MGGRQGRRSGRGRYGPSPAWAALSAGRRDRRANYLETRSAHPKLSGRLPRSPRSVFHSDFRATFVKRIDAIKYRYGCSYERATLTEHEGNS